jgi:hypothetical protein
VVPAAGDIGDCADAGIDSSMAEQAISSIAVSRAGIR